MFKNNKIPPNIPNEGEKIVKQKKPLFKKWWFWLILLLLLFFGGCVSCSSDTTTVEESNEHSSSKETKKENSKDNDEVYKIGDVIKVTTSEGSYTLSIDSIEETDERNQYSDTEANRVVRIFFTYKNIDMEENLYIFDSNFKPYDKDGVSLETYPVDTTAGQQISAGRTTSGSMAFALNNDNNYIELEYYDNMFNDTKDCMIILEW